MPMYRYEYAQTGTCICLSPQLQLLLQRQVELKGNLPLTLADFGATSLSRVLDSELLQVLILQVASYFDSGPGKCCLALCLSLNIWAVLFIFYAQAPSWVTQVEIKPESRESLSCVGLIHSTLLYMLSGTYSNNVCKLQAYLSVPSPIPLQEREGTQLRLVYI